MSTLSDTLKLYSSTADELERITTLADKASVKLLKASRAADTFSINIKKVGDRIKPVNSSLSKFTNLGTKMSKSFKVGSMVKDFSRLKTEIAAASGAAGTLNKKLKNVGASGKTSSNGASKSFKLGSIPTEPLKKGMGIADNYVNMQTRLKSVNDGSQTDNQLQKNVFSAANRSRGSYSDMVDTFATLQTSAGDMFGSNIETLGFAELTQKSFKLGGADSATQSSGMDQVIQAMGSGKIESGAFDALTASAPIMLQAMETFTGKSKAELRSMAEEGTLTADILKNSMFAASDNINGKFSEMPMTFANIWDRIKNAALQAFGGAIEGISNFINSTDFQTFLNAVIVGIYAVGSVLEWLIDNLDYIAPILEVIGGVLLATIITNLWAAAVAAWALVSEFIILNWNLILIVAVIVAVITVLGAMGVTVQDIFSFIGGAISVFIAWLNNIPIVISNMGTWISKTIDDFVTKAVNKVIEGVNTVISALKSIMGVDIKLLDEYQGSTSGMKYKELKSYSDAYKEGSQRGGDFYTGISDKISNFTNGFGLGSFGGLDVTNYEDLGTTNNPLTVQGVGSNGTLGVDMAEEDIQYLRDIAERDYINKFSTATVAPNIQVTFGDVHKEADADKVASRIQLILQEQIATASEGVY